MANESKLIVIEVDLLKGLEDIAKLSKAISLLDEQNKKLNLTIEAQAKQYAENKVQQKEYRQQLNVLIKESANEAKVMVEKLGHIQRLKAEVSNLTLAYERLSKAELESAKGKEVLTALKEKRAELSQLNEAYGNYSLGVGNYGRATNNLSIQLGQVMKELPNFAISARIGIMSLTNNLPMLAEAFKQVKIQQAEMIAQGQKAPSMFSLITKSVFGLTGIVSLAMVALQVFGGQIIEWAKDAIIGETAADRLAAANERLNQSYENSKRIMNERIEMLKLTGKLESEIIAEQINESNRRYLENEGRELAGLKNDLAIGKSLNKQRKERFKELTELEVKHGNEIADLQSQYRIALVREEKKANDDDAKETERVNAEKAKKNKEYIEEQKKLMQKLIDELESSQTMIEDALNKSQFYFFDVVEANAKKALDESINMAKGMQETLKSTYDQMTAEDSANWEKQFQNAVFYADLELATLEAKNKSTLDAKINLLNAEEHAELNSAYRTSEERDKIEQYYAAKRQEIKREELKTQLMATGDMLGAIAGLFEENTTEYKIFATAQALMNTYLGVTNALGQTQGGIIAQVAGAVTAFATGIAAVKKIWTVKMGSSPEGASATKSSGSNGTSTVKFHSGGVAGSAPDSPAKEQEITRTLLTTERVLSPKQTSIFDSMISSIASRGGADSIVGNVGANSTSFDTVYAAMSKALQEMPAPVMTWQEFERQQQRQQRLKANAMLK